MVDALLLLLLRGQTDDAGKAKPAPPAPATEIVVSAGSGK